MTLRPARAPLLTEIAHAAKRHWGYPEAWIGAWREALTITPELMARQRVVVAEVDRHLGARRVGEVPAAVEGTRRTLPRLRLELGTA